MLLSRTSVLVILAVFLLCPTIVLSQNYIRVAICTLCSGAFIAFGCPNNYDSLYCRLSAFKLNVLNCRTYPCVDYDSPIQNTCVEFPLGCPIQHIKIFGLCAPLKMCCGTGGPKEDASPEKLDKWRKLTKQSLSKFRNMKRLQEVTQLDKAKAAMGQEAAVPNPPEQSAVDGMSDASSNFDFEKSRSNYIFASSTKEYIQDVPQNLDDPVVAEQTIMDEYEKFKHEVHAVNNEEISIGRQPIIIPSFDHFRGVALGHKPIKYKEREE